MKVEGRTERLEDALGDDHRTARLAVRDEDAELVAAEPDSQVGRPQALGQALADGAQQLVAGGVAERVVDGLEVVQVHEQDGRPHAAAGLARRVPR